MVEREMDGSGFQEGSLKDPGIGSRPLLADGKRIEAAVI
jgi:hypothetical protein